mmetsp:Transcript_17411/g.29876  ORF Transcript_17411/g.29876 Transcript_17411/m.29876 type:complete len:94 (+) Transcript_17411:120-401(+)
MEAGLEARAAAAEERLAKLETLLGGGMLQPGSSSTLLELKATLEQARAETIKLVDERDKAVVSASKLHYQVAHLKRALEEADKQLGRPTVSLP